MSPPYRELHIPLPVPGVDKPCFTYCKIFGSLDHASKRPLVIVHGGPGMCHNALLSVADLSAGGTPVIFYDQLGGGKSTHLPEKNGDAAFWTEDLFMNEFDNLVNHLGIEKDFDVLGQSWGGMLMSRYAATRQPKGLHRLIIANSPISMELWVEAANELRKQLPQDVQDILAKHEEAGTTGSGEYQFAMLAYIERFVCRTKPMPEDVLIGVKLLEEDPTVYHTMNGPSDFYITGSLKGWSMVADAQRISVPTLLINGRYDAARDSVVAPWFALIPRVRWVTFAESSHMPHLEERERYMEVVSGFLYGP